MGLGPTSMLAKDGLSGMAIISLLTTRLLWRLSRTLFLNHLPWVLAFLGGLIIELSSWSCTSIESQDRTGWFHS